MFERQFPFCKTSVTVFMTLFYEAMLLSYPDDPLRQVNEIDFICLDALQEKF